MSGDPSVNKIIEEPLDSFAKSLAADVDAVRKPESIWFVLSIGCIECGATNDPDDIFRGVFTDREQALAKVAELRPEPGNSPGACWWVNDHESGGFSTTNWQVRIIEISLPPAGNTP